MSETLPYMESNPAIKIFRHALALDEHRVMFAPLYYTPDAKNDSALEVWFSGCHGDVGGGSVKTGTTNSLARIALRWMIGECFKVNTGIIFKEAGLRTLVINCEKEDRLAAGSPIQDSDEPNLNLLQRFVGHTSVRTREPPSMPAPRAPFISPPSAVTLESIENSDKGRTIQEGAVYCHRTVETRKENNDINPGYDPRAKWTAGTYYVDSNLQSVANLLWPEHPIPHATSSPGPPCVAKIRENMPKLEAES